MIRVIRETHETPRFVRERLRLAGGLNRIGEPRFRIVWGWNRLSWICGKWTDRDANGNEIRSVIEARREPKYFPLDRWHVERWLPAEAYGSPEQWRATTRMVEDGIAFDALGPYPSRGDYELVMTLADAEGGFLPLTPAAAEYIVRAVVWTDQQPRGTKKQALRGREERKEAAASAKDDEILGLAFDEADVKGESMVTVV